MTLTTYRKQVDELMVQDRMAQERLLVERSLLNRITKHIESIV